MAGYLDHMHLLIVSAVGGTTAWVVIGFLGQAVFGCRFLVQWIVSEIRQESTIPLAFWFLSIAGGLILLSYAIYRKDPVFIVGQIGGLAIYSRNLVLISRKRARSKKILAK